jgi:predicted  nucleic acid-binding Zn-ribbon protein
VTTVNEQLHHLVKLQNLDTLIKESEDPASKAGQEELGLRVDNVDSLREARDELVTSIDGRWLRVYERLTQRYPRAVVPVEDRTCLGCFQNVPPSFFSEVTADRPVKVCENCGRILYLVSG